MPPPTVTDPPAVDPAVTTALQDVYDPCCREKGISVVDMGLLHRARIRDGHARVELLLTSGWCPFAGGLLEEIGDAIEALPGVDRADVEIVWDEVWGPGRLSDDARAKLRFLPDPRTVSSPDQYLTDTRGETR